VVHHFLYIDKHTKSKTTNIGLFGSLSDIVPNSITTIWAICKHSRGRHKILVRVGSLKLEGLVTSKVGVGEWKTHVPNLLTKEVCMKNMVGFFVIFQRKEAKTNFVAEKHLPMFDCVF
jgi:hypothetical protein